MLSATQALINRRTGWATWFTNLMMLFGITVVVLVILVAILNPTGFRFAALGLICGCALGLIFAAGFALEAGGPSKWDPVGRISGSRADRFHQGIKEFASYFMSCFFFLGLIAALVENWTAL